MTERFEIVPGVVVEVDTAKWEMLDGMGLTLFGRDHRIYIDLRITSDGTGETSKAESVITLRTA